MGEMGGVKICPACGMENPINRVTCTVCHTKMKEGKDKKQETEVENPTPPDTDATEVTPQQPTKKSRKRTKKAHPPEEAAVPKKKITRRRRTKVTASPDPVFLMVDRGKLRAVTVKLVVSKPIRPINLPDTEKCIITFLNRNVALFSG